MLNIEFCDLETQNAVYREACKYEGFKVKDWNDITLVYKDFNYMKYYYDEVSKTNSMGYGLEQSISDYLMLQNQFLLTDDLNSKNNGTYCKLIDDMECEVFDIKHYGED